MPVKEGWLFTLQSIEDLTRDLIENEGFRWFATRRVNQDNLEVYIEFLLEQFYLKILTLLILLHVANGICSYIIFLQCLGRRVQFP